MSLRNRNIVWALELLFLLSPAPVTHAAALRQKIAWDGRWIVFTSERFGSADIVRVHPDGSGLERLTDSPAFDDQGELSPDGRMVAFVSTRGGGTANISLLDTRTKHAVNLTKNHSGNFRPRWSPDGKWIAFSSDRDTHPGRYIRANGAPGS